MDLESAINVCTILKKYILYVKITLCQNMFVSLNKFYPNYKPLIFLVTVFSKKYTNSYYT